MLVDFFYKSLPVGRSENVNPITDRPQSVKV